MKNFGILLRGKSLEKANLILSEFNDCIIVNNFKVELSHYVESLKEKNIIHFVNAMPSTRLNISQYKKLNIKTIQFSFTKKQRDNKHSNKKIGTIISYYKSLNLNLNLHYAPDKLNEKISNIHNTGVTGILWVSECLKPENIWIAGLDFYENNYMVKKNASHQKKKSKDIDLFGSFIKIIKDNPNINYNLISYYKKFPKLENLNII